MGWDDAAGAYKAVTADRRFLCWGGSRQEAVARLAHAVAPGAGSDEASRGLDRFPIWTLLGFLPFAAAGLNGIAALLGVNYKKDARGQFAHSNAITLLNRDGEVAHQLAGLSQDHGSLLKAVAAVAAPARSP